MKNRLVWCQPGPGAVATARPGCHLRTYAPAGSLGSAFAGLRRGAGRNRIAAGANRKERPAISALPRPCPVPPPSSGAPCRAHALPVRRAADRFALLRGFGRPGSAIARRRRSRHLCLAPCALGPGSVPVCRHPLRRVALLPGGRRWRRLAQHAPARRRPPACAGAGSCPPPCRNHADQGSRLRRSCL